MGHIFAIGGGEIRNTSTLSIDKQIIASVKKKVPKCLFIPTASSDAIGYVETMEAYYGEQLGCLVESLYLLKGGPSYEDIRHKILSSDIIYVGGGNTKMMMATWKVFGVDKILKEAYELGIILCGLSAGAICWFDMGQSDSETIASGEKKPYTLVNGLGLIPFVLSPHYNEDEREYDFYQKIKKLKRAGLALTNNCAIEYKDNKYRILKSQEEAKAYTLIYESKEVYRSEIKVSEAFDDLI